MNVRVCLRGGQQFRSAVEREHHPCGNVVPGVPAQPLDPVDHFPRQAFLPERGSQHRVERGHVGSVALDGQVAGHLPAHHHIRGKILKSPSVHLHHCRPARFEDPELPRIELRRRGGRQRGLLAVSASPATGNSAWPGG